MSDDSIHVEAFCCSLEGLTAEAPRTRRVTAVLVVGWLCALASTARFR